jgi:DNA-binding NarL/FixJ family response regulator
LPFKEHVKSGGPSVLLVDDEPRLRAQLRAVLDDHEVVVVGEAGTGREGVELACRLQPQVVLMDLRMPELDGIAATRLLLARQPSAVVLILSAYTDPALMGEARQAGARGYLVKGCRVGELVEAITSAAAAQAAAAPAGAGAVDRLEAGSSSG